MEKDNVKPKLVYFMTPTKDYSPMAMVFFVDNIIKCLSEFFDVVVVSEVAIMPRYVKNTNRSHTVSGHCRWSGSMPTGNKKVSAFPTILKIGFMQIDAYSPGRGPFFLMERLGIETMGIYLKRDTCMPSMT
jgi:hypothetical protein